MKKLVLAVAGLILLASFRPLMAQEAPPPRKAPRAPVHRQSLPTRQPELPPARDVRGVPTIIDGEKLKIGDVDLRLFGVVPPQLSASFGPQARAALDAAAAGKPVSCHIRDRDRDRRFLATCRTESGADMALELLRRGLAVAARGSLADTEFSSPYLAAEQATQNQKIGLWSAPPPAPAAVTAATTTLSASSVPAPSPATEPSASAPASDKGGAKDNAAHEGKTSAPEKQAAAESVTASSGSGVTVKVTGAPPSSAEGHTEVSPPLDGSAARAASTPLALTAEPGFFARYQILTAGLLMLVTVIGILAAMGIQRRQEKRDELRALAAALRGELLAARAVCITRLKDIHNEDDDRNAVWPRLRATLYQAYVGRIGWLGAELARQIASIYGQASDYAAYYNAAGTNDDAKTTATPRRQALQILIHHIEDVLPRLARIEQTGRVPVSDSALALTHAAAAAPSAQPKRKTGEKASSAPARPVDAKAEEAASAIQDALTAHEESPTSATPKLAASEVTAHPPALPAATAAPARKRQRGGTVAAVMAASALPAALWESLRHFVRERLPEQQQPEYPPTDEAFPDYATLIEEDLAKLSFTEGEAEDQAAKEPKPRRSGS